MHAAIIIIALFLSCSNIFVEAEVAKCHADCHSPTSSRPVGPTRPWDVKDNLGNDLSLTRPYPYSIAGSSVSIVKFNFSMTIHNLQVINLSSIDEFQKFVAHEEEMFTETIESSILSDYNSFKVRILNDPRQVEAVYETFTNNFNNTTMTHNDYEVTAKIEINADHNGYNLSSATSFFLEDIRPVILLKIDSELQKDFLVEYSPESHQLLNRSFTLGDQPSSFEVDNDLGVENPNPYTAFCEIGCSLFFSLPIVPVELVHCTDECDDLYRYNVTVGYNDLAEVARLECRDGCQMALKRCQPGYYCPQVQLDKTRSITVEKPFFKEERAYERGFMAHCEAGTYRDVDYNSVESCVPCPPGRFREDIKGRNLESCSKCPAGTYNRFNGSSSMLDCLRCPAGTFTNEPGSEFCICITPAACSPDQLPSPADAEKKDTIPYIGRW